MVGVPGVTRLAQHTICWNGYQSSRRAPHGPEMQNTSSSCWFTTTAAVRSIDWSQEATVTLLRQAQQALPPISKGDTVRMKLPGQNRWDAGIGTGQVAPRSYEVKVGHGIYRRNQRQLLVSTDERNRDVQRENPLPEGSPRHGESGGPPPEEPRSESTGPIILRQSARESRAPEWHKDYHMPGMA